MIRRRYIVKIIVENQTHINHSQSNDIVPFMCNMKICIDSYDENKELIESDIPINNYSYIIKNVIGFLNDKGDFIFDNIKYDSLLLNFECISDNDIIELSEDIINTFKSECEQEYDNLIYYTLHDFSNFRDKLWNIQDYSHSFDDLEFKRGFVVDGKEYNSWDFGYSGIMKLKSKEKDYHYGSGKEIFAYFYTSRNFSERVKESDTFRYETCEILCYDLVLVNEGGDTKTGNGNYEINSEMTEYVKRKNFEKLETYDDDDGLCNRIKYLLLTKSENNKLIKRYKQICKNYYVSSIINPQSVISKTGVLFKDVLDSGRDYLETDPDYTFMGIPGYNVLEILKEYTDHMVRNIDYDGIQYDKQPIFGQIYE